MTDQYYLWLAKIAAEDAASVSMAGFGAMIALMFWLAQFVQPTWKRWLYPLYLAWLAVAIVAMIVLGFQAGQAACEVGL